tara:strand:- start:977 stop:1846 length:870 start_codon:yes stop_codon:yes gene_type:complete
METPLSINTLFSKTDIKEKFEQLLGKKAQGFMSSVIQVVNSNDLLKKVDPNTVLASAATAAALDLPINQSLGFAWIVPYKGKAQFQIGWKGFVQLALRTGQYQSLNVIDVYENQFNSFNTLTEEIDANFSIEGEGDIIAYVAYLKLNNGFTKTTLWTKEKVTKHAEKYSKAFKSQHSPWSSPDTFHAMAKKTVLKNMLSKYGIMSIELSNAITRDQAVMDDNFLKYSDNPTTIDIDAQNIEEEQSRAEKFIKEAKTQESLRDLEDTLIVEESLTEEIKSKLEQRKLELS